MTQIPSKDATHHKQLKQPSIRCGLATPIILQKSIQQFTSKLSFLFLLSEPKIFSLSYSLSRIATHRLKQSLSISWSDKCFTMVVKAGLRVRTNILQPHFYQSWLGFDVSLSMVVFMIAETFFNFGISFVASVLVFWIDIQRVMQSKANKKPKHTWFLLFKMDINRLKAFIRTKESLSYIVTTMTSELRTFIAVCPQMFPSRKCISCKTSSCNI